MSAVGRRRVFIVILSLLSGLMVPQRLEAWTNLLKDPGFEKYHLDRRGFYRPGPDSKWIEVAMGRGSVQMDMNGWEAPEQMVREHPLGFTPATTGYEGEGPEQNTGRIIMQQDVLLPDVVTGKNQFYEAWVWLGGGGRDDDNNGDREDEAGGWELFFYGDDKPSAWTEDKALEHHQMSRPGGRPAKPMNGPASIRWSRWTTRTLQSSARRTCLSTATLNWTTAPASSKAGSDRRHGRFRGMV
jgi:hypothetical protein